MVEEDSVLEALPAAGPEIAEEAHSKNNLPLDKNTLTQLRNTFADTLANELFRELCYAGDVSAGRASARQTFAQKTAKNATKIIAGLAKLIKLAEPSGLAAGTATFAVTVGGDALIQRLGKRGRQTLNLLDSLFKCTEPGRVQVALGSFAQLAAQRYEGVLATRLSANPHESAIPLARVGARRVLNYLQTLADILQREEERNCQDAADLLLGHLDANQLSFEQLCLDGLIRGQSGGWVETLRNTKLVGRGRCHNPTAEGVFARPAMQLLSAPQGPVYFHRNIKGSLCHTAFLFTDVGVGTKLEHCGAKYGPIFVDERTLSAYGYAPGQPGAGTFERSSHTLPNHDLTIYPATLADVQRYQAAPERDGGNRSRSFIEFIQADHPAITTVWLRDVDLTSLGKLEQLDFSNVDLTGANLSDLTLTEVKFNQASADFLQAQGTTWKKCQCQQTRFRFAVFDQATLEHTDVFQAQWLGVHCREFKDNTIQTILTQLSQPAEQQAKDTLHLLDEIAAHQQRYNQQLDTLQASTKDNKSKLEGMQFNQLKVYVLQQRQSLIVRQLKERMACLQGLETTTKLDLSAVIADLKTQLDKGQASVDALAKELSALEQRTTDTTTITNHLKLTLGPNVKINRIKAYAAGLGVHIDDRIQDFERLYQRALQQAKQLVQQTGELIASNALIAEQGILEDVEFMNELVGVHVMHSHASSASLTQTPGTTFAQPLPSLAGQKRMIRKTLALLAPLKVEGTFDDQDVDDYKPQLEALQTQCKDNQGLSFEQWSRVLTMKAELESKHSSSKAEASVPPSMHRLPREALTPALAGDALAAQTNPLDLSLDAKESAAGKITFTVVGKKSQLKAINLAYYGRTHIHQHLPETTLPEGIHCLLPPTLSNFTGRTTDCEKLNQAFAQDAASPILRINQKIAGMGGVGKTQLAIAWAHQQLNAERYAGLYWLDANALDYSLQKLAALYGVDPKQVGQGYLHLLYAKIQAQCLRWQKPCLFIFDNVEHYHKLKPYLPNFPAHCIVTSRDQTSWGSSIQTLTLGCFTRQEASDYITNSLNQDKEAQSAQAELKTQPNLAHDLAQELHDFPLALTQAIAFIANPDNGINTLEAYLDHYKTAALACAKTPLYPDDPHQATVFVTLHQVLATLTPTAKQLALYFSFLSPDLIPADFIRTFLTQRLITDTTDLTSLRQYSLIGYDATNKTYHMHPVNQTLLRAEAAAQQIELLTALMSHMTNRCELETPDQPLVDEIRCNSLIPVMDAILSYAQDLSATGHAEADFDLTLSSLYFHRSNCHARAGEPLAAKTLLQATRDLMKRHDVAGPRLAATLGNLANAEGQLGNTHEMKHLLERALAIEKQHFGEQHWQVAITLGNLANAEGDLGNTHQMKHLLERALAIQKQHFGEQHWQIAATLGSLANTEGDLGNTHEMKHLLERALVIQKQHFGEQHWQLATTLANLANAEGQLGNTHQKKHLLERALAIETQHFGEQHWQLATTLSNLANAEGDLDNTHQKKHLLERALAIQTQHFGEQHWQLAATLGSLANTEGDLGNTHEMKHLLERALAIQKQHFGNQHWQVAITLANLANAEGDLGNTHQMKHLLERALAIQKQHFGNQHWQVAITLGNLANAEGQLGNTHEMKHLLERALAIKKQHFGEQHWQIATTLVNLANAEGDLGNTHQMKHLLERALAIQKQHFGKQHWQIANTLVNLANAEGQLGNTHQMKHLLERALTIQKQHFGEQHWQIATTLVNLASAEGDLGNTHKKKHLLERALAIQKQHFSEQHWQVAITRFNLSALEVQLGEYQSALTNLQWVFDKFESQLGMKHSHTQKAVQLYQYLITCLVKASYSSTIPEITAELASTRADKLIVDFLTGKFSPPDSTAWRVQFDACRVALTALLQLGARLVRERQLPIAAQPEQPAFLAYLLTYKIESVSVHDVLAGLLQLRAIKARLLSQSLLDEETEPQYSNFREKGVTRTYSY